jgi:hypothetical protein
MLSERHLCTPADKLGVDSAGTTTYSYDAVGNPAGMPIQRGDHFYTYDPLNDLTQIGMAKNAVRYL